MNHSFKWFIKNKQQNTYKTRTNKCTLSAKKDRHYKTWTKSNIKILAAKCFTVSLGYSNLSLTTKLVHTRSQYKKKANDELI